MNTDKILDAVLWSQIKNFKPYEFGKDYSKVSMDLIILLDRLRSQTGEPISIHCAYATDGHSDKSQHYKGLATDLHSEADDVIFLQEAKRLGFTGIGYYPKWKPKPGFHLDIREGKPVYWYSPSNGVYEYVSFNELLEYVKSLQK